jgi:hypothetical protein
MWRQRAQRGLRGDRIIDKKTKTCIEQDATIYATIYSIYARVRDLVTAHDPYLKNPKI